MEEKMTGAKALGQGRMWYSNTAKSGVCTVIEEECRRWRCKGGGVALKLLKVTQSCLTLCDPMDCSTPGFPVLYHFPEFLKFMAIESLMPSNHFIFCRPFLLLPSIFPCIRVFPNKLVLLCIRWPKYWSFSISSSNEYSGLISFRMDWSPYSPRNSQESSPTPCFKSINSSVLSLLYGPTLTVIHDYWKNHSLD